MSQVPAQIVANYRNNAAHLREVVTTMASTKFCHIDEQLPSEEIKKQLGMQGHIEEGVATEYNDESPHNEECVGITGE